MAFYFLSSIYSCMISLIVLKRKRKKKKSREKEVVKRIKMLLHDCKHAFLEM